MNLGKKRVELKMVSKSEWIGPLVHEFQTNAFNLVLDGEMTYPEPELRSLISIVFDVPNSTEGAGDNWISGGMFAILVMPLARSNDKSYPNSAPTACSSNIMHPGPKASGKKMFNVRQ